MSSSLSKSSRFGRLQMDDTRWYDESRFSVTSATGSSSASSQEPPPPQQVDENSFEMSSADWDFFDNVDDNPSSPYCEGKRRPPAIPRASSSGNHQGSSSMTLHDDGIGEVCKSPRNLSRRSTTPVERGQVVSDVPPRDSHDRRVSDTGSYRDSADVSRSSSRGRRHSSSTNPRDQDNSTSGPYRTSRDGRSSKSSRHDYVDDLAKVPRHDSRHCTSSTYSHEEVSDVPHHSSPSYRRHSSSPYQEGDFTEPLRSSSKSSQNRSSSRYLDDELDRHQPRRRSSSSRRRDSLSQSYLDRAPSHEEQPRRGSGHHHHHHHRVPHNAYEDSFERGSRSQGRRHSTTQCYYDDNVYEGPPRAGRRSSTTTIGGSRQTAELDEEQPRSRRSSISSQCQARRRTMTSSSPARRHSATRNDDPAVISMQLREAEKHRKSSRPSGSRKFRRNSSNASLTSLASIFSNESGTSDIGTSNHSYATNHSHATNQSYATNSSYLSYDVHGSSKRMDSSVPSTPRNRPPTYLYDGSRRGTSSVSSLSTNCMLVSPPIPHIQSQSSHA